MSRFECHALTKKYGQTTALDNIELSLEAGQIVGLLGPNGSGKTTLIKIANNLLTVTEGSLTIEGLKPGKQTKSMVAYLPDQECLPGFMNVNDLIRYYKDFFSDFNEYKCRKMLDSLDISHKMTLKKMSKGTREKVQLIMTMSRDAQIYLLDEPIAGVDPAARDYVLNTIINNYSPKALVIISTHLIADVEPILDDIVFINNGHIVLHQNADDLREEHGMSVDAYFRETFRY
ncbi:MAG: ABC transporter ATP-binding protein [Erysipelotrichaceae bacterium]|nr:ABC transporter ATP-binding protein [Erysipelotrichaceae bacterium]